MKTQELIEYLQGFAPEADVRIIALNVQERKKYHSETVVITDGPIPAIFVNVIGSASFDEEERQTVDEIESETRNN